MYTKMSDDIKPRYIWRGEEEWESSKYDENQDMKCKIFPGISFDVNL